MIVLFETGSIRLMCKHVQLKDNTYYYRRRVPKDVRKLHKDPDSGKPKAQLFFSLKTSDKVEACRQAESHTRRLDALWRAYRERNGAVANPLVALATLEANGLGPGYAKRHPDDPTIDHFLDYYLPSHEAYEPRPKLTPQEQLTLDILYGEKVPRTLSEAKEEHFALGKGPKNKVGQQQFDRAWSLLMDITGDITLDCLNRSHANEFVRRLVASGVGPETVKRYLSQVRPVIKTGIQEFEISMNNPFEGVVIPNRDESPRKPRQPYSMAELDAIQAKCRETDDQRRWAIAMLSDTGARLAEIAGLAKQDVFLDASIPHIYIRPNAYRGLKTKSSERRVPLVGAALWAAQRAMQTEGQALFPVFQPKQADKQFNANSASSALNAWLKGNGLAREGQGLHSFRHTMRDRLRNVTTPQDLANRIGGWENEGVGESYGQGYSLEVMQRYLLKIVRPPERGSDDTAIGRVA
ncbi:hypothetical protein BMI90_08435 [Thioclava sp. L04-15]|uniref:DUF6538 domain-containing protein n=1 Tax=Thioclava sp. L04-15 TaxID=1915318 RepID=UPI0009984F07|nr:DUF6538 domain-containing protein [Thioclava sp. L04-15]OOY27921.1 hypothetical protein BMI90_08435 [Thioclava sp. L04-15]TNE93543.1 MAG: hypothetical protein EP337_03305 [Paracoccaceae bacterium]